MRTLTEIKMRRLVLATLLALIPATALSQNQIIGPMPGETPTRIYPGPIQLPRLCQPRYAIQTRYEWRLSHYNVCGQAVYSLYRIQVLVRLR